MTAEHKEGGLFPNLLEMDLAAQRLLARFYEWLKSTPGGGLEAADASPLAHDADRYCRDFLVEILEMAPESSNGKTLNAYLANWYIINTLEPSHAEMDRIFKALSLFQGFLGESGLLPGASAAGEQVPLPRPERFHDRLEAFWALTPEKVPAWRSEDDFRNLLPSRAKKALM